ncbi:TPA: VCBS domain-containing protein, partial [Klebsiella aerogenes]
VKANSDYVTYIIPKTAVKPKDNVISGSTQKTSTNDSGFSVFFPTSTKPEVNVKVEPGISGVITAKFSGLNFKFGSPYIEIIEKSGSVKPWTISASKSSIFSLESVASIDLTKLLPGDYTIKAHASSGVSLGFENIEFLFDHVVVRDYSSPESLINNALPLFKGDVLKNDAKDGVKTIKVGAVEGKAIGTTKVADFVTVKGKYGDLKMFANGSYEYKANNLNVNDIKKENVDKFTYTVQSPELPGKASTAVLEITIPKFDANEADPRVKRSLSDDEFTHNPEFESHNSNKTAVEGKANDYGKLLVSGHGQINLDNVAGKEKPSDLKSPQADSHVPYSEGAWHSDVKPHHEEHITHDI